MSQANIRQWTEPALPEGLSNLIRAGVTEGHEFLLLLDSEWSNGFRYDRPGEGLFVAEMGGAVVGMAGICCDPFQASPTVGRLRHVYVDAAFRSKGVAGRLVRACPAHADPVFETIRLTTHNPSAEAFYLRLGFRPLYINGENMTHVRERPRRVT